jgi:hypothetical protein
VTISCRFLSLVYFFICFKQDVGVLHRYRDWPCRSPRLAVFLRSAVVRCLVLWLLNASQHLSHLVVARLVHQELLDIDVVVAVIEPDTSVDTTSIVVVVVLVDGVPEEDVQNAAEGAAVVVAVEQHSLPTGDFAFAAVRLPLLQSPGLVRVLRLGGEPLVAVEVLVAPFASEAARHTEPAKLLAEPHSVAGAVAAFERSTADDFLARSDVVVRHTPLHVHSIGPD